MHFYGTLIGYKPFKVFYIINSFTLKTKRTLTSELMMVAPTWSLADMHAKETDTINTLRVYCKTRENAFSWRESGDKL
jgi:hypothetical protein